MTWYKVDDSFHSHPKASATSLAALGLWVVAGSWSGNHLTDGFVPDHVAQLLSRGASELATELVARGLWKRTRGGYQFHDWNAYQPTRESVARDREAAKERQRRKRERAKPAGQEVAVTEVSRRDSRVTHAVVPVGSGQLPGIGNCLVGGNSSSAVADTPRPDAQRLCDHLADRIAGNGSKRPTISKAWLTAARLMLDADGHTEEQVHRAIDWCQDDEFWRGNVLSMPKLRSKYDQLRLKAAADRGRTLTPVPALAAIERNQPRAAVNGHRPYQDPIDSTYYDKDW